MPQDVPTTARDGGTDTSIDADNAEAEIVVTASAPEEAATVGEALDALDAEIAEIEEELRGIDPAASQEDFDYAMYLSTQRDIARFERDMLANHGIVVDVESYLAELDPGFNPETASGQEWFSAYSRNIGGIDVLARARQFSSLTTDYAYTVADFLSLGRAAKLLPKKSMMRWLRRQLGSRMRRPRRTQERIRARRRRRNQRKCRARRSNPVFVDNGAVSQADPVFSLPGLIELTLGSAYQSDLDLAGPLGWGRVSDIDASLERLADGKLRYRDGAGFHVDFDRPTPNPGHWNPGDHVRHMEIAAGPDRTFLVREQGLTSHFAKRQDGTWSLSAIETRNGARLIFERDEAGFLQAIETPEGLRLEMTNDTARGLRLSVDLVGVDGSRVSVMRYAYDGDSNMTLAECPFGEKHEYAYDAAHRRIWFRKNDQYEGRYHFDDAGRCVLEETNGPYDGTRFEYDPEKGMTRHIPGGDPERTEIIYYGADGGVFAEAHVSGRFDRTYHDEAGNVACTQDGEGNRTQFRYDQWGNITSIEDPEERISDFRWTEDGQMEFAIDPSGATWENDYDENGNQIGTTDPLGFNTEIKVNEMGQPIGICRHDGMIRALSYDEHHWLTGIVDFDGCEVVFERDAFGRVIRKTHAERVSTIYEYGGKPGLDYWTPSSVRLEDDFAIRREVIEPRRHYRQLDGSGRRTDFHIDGFGKIEIVEDSKGGRLSFHYDHQEDLTEIENQTGQVWRFERDARGRIVRETDFGGAEITYRYDEADRLVASTYPDGTRHLLTLDKSGLLLREVVESPGQEPLETIYTYDDRGLLQQARNVDATVTFERDTVGQVTAETINGTRIETSWDCCGRRTSRTVGGEIVAFSYDPVGLLSALEIDGHAPLKIDRDELGHETGRVSSMGFRLQQRFSAVGLLLDQRIASAITLPTGGGGKTLRLEPGRSYRWNSSVEPEVIDDAIWGTTRYSYDANGQITRTMLGDGTSESFSYDKRHNLDGATFGDALGQARTLADRLLGWGLGPDGRVTEASGPKGETIRLSYDAKGRVVEKTLLANGFRPPHLAVRVERA